MAGRILVLDDEENYAEMLKDLLVQHNYCVDMATRPERAIDQIEEIPYDLIISDYKMPVMDGADFLKKSRELYPNLPFILVSGLMNTPELVKVANMSVTLVMEKPLDTETFLKHVARFSDPMTDEEKAMQEQSAAGNGDDGGPANYPEEPRFVCALSEAAKGALQKAWSISKRGSVLYLFDAMAGDAELAAKDFSRWRGNEDLPVASLEMPGSAEAGVSQIRAVLADEHSQTIFIRLSSETELPHAPTLADRVNREVEGAESILLVFALHAQPGSVRSPESLQAYSVTLPPLSMRPVDLAAYTRRFLKLASERAGHEDSATLSPEAVYQILAFDWPEGLPQLQSVLSRAVELSEPAAPIGAEPIQELIGVTTTTSPDQRMAELMQSAQKNYIKARMRQEGLSAGETARLLELRPVDSESDLSRLPLVQDAFGTL